jgi:hypothetical protein
LNTTERKRLREIEQTLSDKGMFLWKE